MNTKKIISFLIVLIMTLSLATPAFATDARSINVSPINVMVGGKIFLPTDSNGVNVPVFVYNGTTYAPLRALAESYGLTVGYDENKKLATVTGSPSSNFVGSKGTLQALTKSTTLTVFPINIEVNGTIFLPKDANGNLVSVFVYNGTTYAPLRALAESYGLTVGYDENKKLATVEFKGSTQNSDMKIWDGTVAKSFAGGTGTRKDPYIIKTPEQLALLAAKVNKGDLCTNRYFVLVNDLDLGSLEWTPIGSYQHGFDGHFDGSGHTISGISITEANDEYVQNNKFHDFIECVGLFGLSEENSFIENLHIKGSIKINKSDAAEKDDIEAGGVVGLARGVVAHCHNFCDISVILPSDGSYINIGGVTGCYTWESALIDSCTNYGTLYGCGNSVVRIGGVAGDNDGHGIVRNCINYGNVESDCSGKDYTGGIVAHTACSDVINCANFGNISGCSVVAGIVARQYGYASFGGYNSILNCLSEGTIKSFIKTQDIGAICGNVETEVGTIDHCYYSGCLAGVGRVSKGNINSLISSSSISSVELLNSLNAWVKQNNSVKNEYVLWTLSSDGRVEPNIIK